jgi:thiamine biosynthesis lipoprotein
MKGKGFVILFIGLFLLAIGTVAYFMSQSKVKNVPQTNYFHNQGDTQGTTYSITYQQPEGLDLQDKIEKRLHEFDMSLSTYIPNSIISRVNRNDTTVRIDELFEVMFNEAHEVSRRTNGALDITVGPLVKAWGFAFGNKDHSKLPNVSDFMSYIGYEKVRIKDHKVIKDDPRIVIDANSIAQGYSSDIIAKLLDDNKCQNYMVEIGGEIVCKGLNDKGQKWRIGIDKAIDDSTSTTEELQTIISITDCAVTTAGGYRKFYIKDGKKYSHIINPHTGRPIENNMLSVTVIAPKGIIADAYDTPFMELGVDSCMKICKSIPGMECYVIYTDKNGKNQVIYSDGFKKYITQ